MKRFVLPMKVQSQNKSHYSHWRKAHANKKKWQNVCATIMGTNNPRKKGHTQVLIISNRNRILDEGNFVGGCKPLIDCLTELGWIEDDRPGLFSCTYKQEKVKPPQPHDTIVVIY